MVTGVVPSPPRFLPSNFIAHRVQQSRCSSIFHRVLLTHALALSASQFVHKKKSHRIYTSMHSAGLELTKLTYTTLEDNLIRHRGDRLAYMICQPKYFATNCFERRLETNINVLHARPTMVGNILSDQFLSLLTGTSDAKNQNHPLTLLDQESSLFLVSEIIEARNHRIG